MVLEVFAKKEAHVSNLVDKKRKKKKREALEVSHPAFSTVLDSAHMLA